jgi:hypothetical protein
VLDGEIVGEDADGGVTVTTAAPGDLGGAALIPGRCLCVTRQTGRANNTLRPMKETDPPR